MRFDRKVFVLLSDAWPADQVFVRRRGFASNAAPTGVAGGRRKE